MHEPTDDLTGLSLAYSDPTAFGPFNSRHRVKAIHFYFAPLASEAAAYFLGIDIVASHKKLTATEMQAAQRTRRLVYDAQLTGAGLNMHHAILFIHWTPQGNEQWLNVRMSPDGSVSGVNMTLSVEMEPLW